MFCASCLCHRRRRRKGPFGQGFFFKAGMEMRLMCNSPALSCMVGCADPLWCRTFGVMWLHISHHWVSPIVRPGLGMTKGKGMLFSGLACPAALLPLRKHHPLRFHRLGHFPTVLSVQECLCSKMRDDGVGQRVTCSPSSSGGGRSSYVDYT